MSNLSMKKNCKVLKIKLKQLYTNVTDEDLDCKDGQQKGKMNYTLQQKLRKNKEELQDMILHHEPD